MRYESGRPWLVVGSRRRERDGRTWTLPKGTPEPGESREQTAVREVEEETSLTCRLGPELSSTHYHDNKDRPKIVRYWVMEVESEVPFEPNDEVDDLGWFRLDDAQDRLTYGDDVDLMEQYREHRKPTASLVVLRHAKAVPRSKWEEADEQRPLSDVGRAQARALPALLHAYGVTRVLTSPSVRCLETVQPYAAEQVVHVVEAAHLSEEGFDARRAAALLRDLMRTRESAVLCTHRPVLPRLLDRLGVAEEPLAAGELVVCHHRKGRLVATERHLPA